MSPIVWHKSSPLYSFAPCRWPSSPSSDSSMSSWSPTQPSSSLCHWPYACWLLNQLQTLFPPALLWTQLGAPIPPWESGMQLCHFLWVWNYFWHDSWNRDVDLLISHVGRHDQLLFFMTKLGIDMRSGFFVFRRCISSVWVRQIPQVQFSIPSAHYVGQQEHCPCESVSHNFQALHVAHLANHVLRIFAARVEDVCLLSTIPSLALGTPRSCLSVSSWHRSSNFVVKGLRWCRGLTCIFPSDGPFLSRILAWRSVDFVDRTLWDCVQDSFASGLPETLFVPWESSASESCNTQHPIAIHFSQWPQRRCPRFLFFLGSSLSSAFLSGCSSTLKWGNKHVSPDLQPAFVFFKIGTRAEANIHKAFVCRIPFE